MEATDNNTNISAAQVKELRDKSGAPMMDCKKALTDARGDIEAAIVLLRKRGASVAERKAGRATSEGSVVSYIHAGGKIGVLVEVNCESDFVARTDDFKELVHDVAMHIAATDPKFVRKEDVTPESFEREKNLSNSGCGNWQARPSRREDRGRQDGEILRRGLPLRTAFHQRSNGNDLTINRNQNRQAWREHCGSPIRPFQGGRCRRDNRNYQAGSKSSRIIERAPMAPFFM